jgi:hypothetical protein
VKFHKTTSILTTMLAIGVVGCASLTPPTNEEIAYKHESEYAQGSPNLGWYLIYYALFGLGVRFGGDQPIQYPN